MIEVMQPRASVVSLCVAIGALFCASASAQLKPPTNSNAAGTTSLSPLVVTATRSPQAIVSLVSDIDVIDTQTWRDRGAQSLSDSLGMMSGISITSNGGPGSTGSVFIRGASGGQTLTLVDGFRVSSVSLGQPTYEALPFSLVDRVEVLRGPGSAYYGADALGGVIQLFTPQARSGRQVLGEIAAGNQSTRRVIGGISGGSGAVSGSLRVSREQSDGYDVTRPSNFAPNPDADGFTRNGVVANIRARLGAQTALKLTMLKNELDTDYDDGAFINARIKADTELLGLTIDHAMAGGSLLQFKAGRTTDRSESISNFPSLFETTQTQYSILNRRKLGPGIELNLGFERLEQEVDTESYGPTGAPSRKTDSLSAALIGRENNHVVQLSYRRDDNSQYGVQNNYTITYGYITSPGVRFGGSYGTGFRAPSFNDLFFPGFGRAGIKPETSKNFELGFYVDKRTKENRNGWTGKFVYYNNSVKDLIVFAPVCPDTDPQFAFGCADNVNRASLSGVSMALGKRHGSWGWQMNADFTNPKDKTLNQVLLRRSKRQLGASVFYNLGEWRFSTDIRAESSRRDSGNVRLGGYGIVNFGVQRKIKTGLNLFLTVTNATDKDYTTAAGFRPQPRLIMLGLRYQARQPN
jgi:vitamin B12 transporter